MRKYLVNSTYCIYLLDIKQLYFDESVCTIKEVIEEIWHERNIIIEAPLIQARKTSVIIKQNMLSNTDAMLLQTSKIMNYVLVSDDQKIITAARENNVRALDTPHFMHRLLIENKLSEDKTLEVLNQLKSIYNRIYIIDKVMKDIKRWR